MPLGPREVPKPVHQESLGSLRSCLVEGDAEQRRRERRVRRRALLTSIFLQVVALILLVLVPLFGKTERISIKDFVPIPPYGHSSGHPQGERRPTNSRPVSSGFHFTSDVLAIRPRRQQTGGSNTDGNSDLDSLRGSQNEGPSCNWCVDIGERSSGPRPPQPIVENPSKPRIIYEPAIDPARIIYRVEPIYPALPKQIHKEGRVELRAIIATDGTIQSLEIVSGDPMFYQSAKEAVSQWRYKPTILNGQPVEIDTYITVIYTLQH